MTTIGIEILQAKTLTYRIRGELQREKNPQQNIEAIVEAITALEGVEPEIFVSNEGDVIAAITLEDTSRFEGDIKRSLQRVLKDRKQSIEDAIVSIRTSEEHVPES